MRHAVGLCTELIERANNVSHRHGRSKAIALPVARQQRLHDVTALFPSFVQAMQRRHKLFEAQLFMAQALSRGSEVAVFVGPKFAEIVQQAVGDRDITVQRLVSDRACGPLRDLARMPCQSAGIGMVMCE